MIFLCIPPLARRHNLRGNRLLKPLLCDFIGDLSGDFELFVVVREDCAAILCAYVGTLSVRRSRIVHTVKELDELTISHDGRVESDLQSFSVYNDKLPLAKLVEFDVRNREKRERERERKKNVRPVLPEHTARYEGESVCPPAYPTLASSNPFPFPKCLR